MVSQLENLLLNPCFPWVNTERLRVVQPVTGNIETLIYPYSRYDKGQLLRIDHPHVSRFKMYHKGKRVSRERYSYPPDYLNLDLYSRDALPDHLPVGNSSNTPTQKNIAGAIGTWIPRWAVKTSHLINNLPLATFQLQGRITPSLQRDTGEKRKKKGIADTLTNHILEHLWPSE